MKPEMKQEIDGYNTLHTRPCGFLEDLLRGRYDRALSHADEDNYRDFEEIREYADSALPADSHGTDVKFDLWLENAPGEIRIVGDGSRRIYCLINSQNGRDEFNTIALCEDGETVGGHMSSSLGWAKHDIGIHSDWHHNDYLAHCPTGFTLIWIDENRVKTDPGLLAAIEKRNAFNQSRTHQ